MNLQNHPLKPLADELMGYCQKEMGFQKPPSLFFQEDPENAKDSLGKTAYYDPSNLKIVIYTTGRHDKDILRSIAHELVHHVQNLRGDFDNTDSTDPGYAQNDPHLRNMEKEAYLLGNMLFRDWEDQKKSQNLKENKIMNKDQLKEMIKGYLTDILNEKQFANSDELDGDKDGEPKWADPDDPANKSGKKDDSSDDDKPKKKAKKGEIPPQLRDHVKGKQDKKEDKEQVDEAESADIEEGKGTGDQFSDDFEAAVKGVGKGLARTTGAGVGAALKTAKEAGKGIVKTAAAPFTGAKAGYDFVKDKLGLEEAEEIEESDEIEEQSKTDMPDRVAGRDAGGRRLNEDDIEEGSCGSYNRDDEMVEELENIQTPEQENALYEARFSNRNEKLFKKLIGKWAK